EYAVAVKACGDGIGCIVSAGWMVIVDWAELPAYRALAPAVGCSATIETASIAAQRPAMGFAAAGAAHVITPSGHVAPSLSRSRIVARRLAARALLGQPTSV